MKIPRLVVYLVPTLLLCFLVWRVDPAAAQYIYIDTNGNGVHDGSDLLSTTATTTVDVWLDTMHNRDGSLAPCANDVGSLDIFSYEFVLRVSGGTVQWGSFLDNMGFPAFAGEGSSATEFFVTRGTSSAMSGGLYRLGSITADVTFGTPVLDFAKASSLRAATGTRFGSHCTGVNFNNTIALGVDFFDADGTAPAQQAGVSTKANQDIVNFNANANAWAQRCIEIKSSTGSFAVTDIDVNSIRMVSIGTGAVNGIPCGKTGVVDLTAGTLTVCFSRADLLKLFGYVANANNQITVAVTGDLFGGGSFSGTVVLKVSFGSANWVARLWPNPIVNESALQVRTAEQGFIRVNLYDAQGRLVRRLLDERDAAPGNRILSILRTDPAGRSLATGIYFYRVEVPGGSTTGRFTILK